MKAADLLGNVCLVCKAPLNLIEIHGGFLLRCENCRSTTVINNPDYLEDDDDDF